MNHVLKTVQPFFERCWDGYKTFEVRNNDRDFQAGDTCDLLEYDPSTDSYSGRQLKIKILYVLSGYSAIQGGYVVFSFSISEHIER